MDTKEAVKLRQDLEIRATHSAGAEYIGKDGVKRQIAVTRFDDESVGLYLRTYWDGETAEPLQSSVRMGCEAYSILLQAMNELALDRERFRIDRAAEPAPAETQGD